MPVLVDESFTSGIPGGFATARFPGGTGLTVTHNAGQGAVDLAPATSSHYYAWSFDGVAQPALRVVVEVDHITFPSSARVGVGFASPWTGTPNALFGVTSGYSDSNHYAGNTANWGSSFPSLRILNSSSHSNSRLEVLTIDTYVVGGNRRLALYQGGILTASILVNGFAGNLIPALYGYGATTRLFRVTISDEPVNVESLPFHGPGVTLPFAGPPIPLGLHTGGNPLHHPNGRVEGVPLPRGERLVHFEGLFNYGPDGRFFPRIGSISGKTERQDGPSKFPYPTRVFLIDQRTNALIMETFAAADGSYVFDGLPVNQEFAVLAYDYLRNFRAVIADRVTPTSPV
jgi:hypothetical protein